MKYWVIFLCFLASCGTHSLKKANRYAEKKFRSKRAAIDVIRQQEAKLVDIPIPISSEPLCEYFAESENPGDVMLAYDCVLSADELTIFFNQEMERCGWGYGAHFSGHERLMQYEKPCRVCTVSLRPKKNSTEIHIYAGPRVCDLADEPV